MKSSKILLNVAVALLSTSMLGSCNIYKKYHTPEDTALTREYAEALKTAPDSAAFGNLQWQEVFTDPVLADLIAQALMSNSNLRNAQLNVQIAQARLQGAKLSYLPSVALAPTGQLGKIEGFDQVATYTLPMQVSWEVDVFGKLLNSKRGAQAAVLQSQEYAQAARSQIISAVANVYYTIAMVEGQLNLSRETAETWAETVQTMKDLKEGGKAHEDAVTQSEAQYYGILASISDLEVSLHELNNTMSLLLNVMPQKFAVSPDATLMLPAIYREGVPMRELASRPDVRAAEYSLAAAYYATASARAAFYPGINITAAGGFSNSLGSAVINPGKFFASLAGTLTAPLFSRGMNISNLKAAKIQQQQALNNFEYALMNASAEVSNAITLHDKAGEKYDMLSKQVESLKSSVEITQTLLSLGSYGTTYLEVLSAQSNLLNAQMGMLASRNSQAAATINLYQALGGGR